MDKLLFPSALHRQTPRLDALVLRWAWAGGIFENPAELERCRLQKVNWFAGYLFPGEDTERLELVMKFFLGLFLLDDLLDACPDSDMMEFLEGLKNGEHLSDLHRVTALGQALLELHEAIGKAVLSPSWRTQWKYSWNSYLEGLQWELRNKEDRAVPRLEEYRFYRPISSGVFLAIHLLRNVDHTEYSDAESLENDIARFICLSNDLASFDKEQALGDFHNELIILGESFGEDTRGWALRELSLLQLRIRKLGKQAEAKSESDRRWVESLFLLLGGCVSWTEETSRYVAYVNGNQRTG